MEKDSDHMDSEEASVEELFPPNSSYSDNLFGAPQVKTRIGDEFQAQIPSIMPKSDYISLFTNPIDLNCDFVVSDSFLMGLPMPIKWLDKRSIEGQLDTRSESPESDDPDLSMTLSEFKASRQWHRTPKTTSCSFLFPGWVGVPWSDSEKDVFHLGLYIFRKNFSSVKVLMGNKSIGEILAFYYGVFYRSAKYRRWLEYRKKRRRKCVYGRKIFTGWRQQELLSRLIPLVAEESRNTLQEMSKSFVERRTSLENYVFYLKDTVGINALVTSIRIGKGKKEDLTRISMGPVKTTSDSVPLRPTFMLTGKPCSSLSSDEIISLLSGDVRLSKARCNDIFWEAVWPRLLARGWHSKQPKKSQEYAGLKNQLVFLLPEVKKFSGRKLVEGEHYFSSINDVLNKVVSEPSLLELKDEENGVNFGNEGDNLVSDESPDDHDELSNHKSHYLKPRVSEKSLRENMKFLIVDTSLCRGGKASDIREMKYLPLDLKVSSKTPLREKVVPDARKKKRIRNGLKDMKFVIVDTSLLHGGKPPSKMRRLRRFPVEFKSSFDEDYFLSEDEECYADKQIVKSDSGGKATSRNSNRQLVPHVKRRRLTACAKTETSHLIKNLLANVESKQVKPCCKSDASVAKNVCQKGDSLENSALVALSKEESNRDKSSGIGSDMMISDKHIENDQNDLLPALEDRNQSQILQGSVNLLVEAESKEPGLDSNDVSQTGPSLENISLVNSLHNEGSSGGRSDGCISPKPMSDMKNENHQPPPMDDQHLSQTLPDSKDGIQTSTEGNVVAAQNDEIPRRQSSRNRPLTTKALEALACGYLDVKTGQKNKANRSDIMFTNPSRKALTKPKVTFKLRGNFITSAGSDGERKEAIGGNITNADMVSGDHMEE